MKNYPFNNAPKVIGKRIKEAREEICYTQAEVARRLKITRASVSVWESGGNITDKNLNALSLLFDTHPAFLRYGCDI